VNIRPKRDFNCDMWPYVVDRKLSNGGNLLGSQSCSIQLLWTNRERIYTSKQSYSFVRKMKATTLCGGVERPNPCLSHPRAKRRRHCLDGFFSLNRQRPFSACFRHPFVYTQPTLPLFFLLALCLAACGMPCYLRYAYVACELVSFCIARIGLSLRIN
jgi:hypothetical protein